MEEDKPEIEQLKRALVEVQKELGSATAALIRSPTRPLRVLFDKTWLEELRPSYDAGREVVRRYAVAAGVDEQTAESEVRPLLSEVRESHRGRAQRIAARERYWSAWRRWGAAQEV